MSRQAQAIAAISALMTPFTREYALHTGGYIVTGTAANNVPIEQFITTPLDVQFQSIFATQDIQPALTSAVPHVWSLSIRESHQWTYFDDLHTLLGQTIIPTVRWDPMYLSWQSDHFVAVSAGHHGGPAPQFERDSACLEDPPLLAPYRRVQVIEQNLQDCLISVWITNSNQLGIFSLQYGVVLPMNSVAASLFPL